MGRHLLYAVILALTVFVLSGTFLLQRGGGSSEAVMQVSVHDLGTFTERYDGEQVTTRGIIVRFTGPREQFAIAEDDLRVAIVGYPEETLRLLEGRRVVVTGVFGFEEGTGRFIEAESVTPTS